MRVWYDTEFLERGPEHPIDLISIGLVAEDGRELYLINGEMPLEAISLNPWLMANVVPHLPLEKIKGTPEFDGELEWFPGGPIYDTCVWNRMQIREMLVAFFDATPHPRLWGYHSAYDHVVLMQCFGIMMDKPAKLSTYTRDLAQVMDHYGILDEDLPKQEGRLHDALADAKWTKLAYDHVFHTPELMQPNPRKSRHPSPENVEENLSW